MSLVDYGDKWLLTDGATDFLLLIDGQTDVALLRDVLLEIVTPSGRRLVLVRSALAGNIYVINNERDAAILKAKHKVHVVNLDRELVLNG